ncbi:unnamed protein product, partial [Umbelopsis ramanniana]
SFMLPCLPAKPCLQSLIANVYDSEDYQALKEISQTCRNTLHTLIINQDYFGVDLDDFNISSNRLKTFGIHHATGVEHHITNFGDNLEHLEYRGWSSVGFRSIIQAMKKTSKLKTLSLVVGNVTLEDIPLILENNKNTLRTLYIRDWVPRSDPDGLIPQVLANKTRLCNVTTLFIECVTLESSDVQTLAEIYPNVEFLRLTRSSNENVSMLPKFILIAAPSKWMTTEDLSHFRHLKAIDESTYAEVIDQNEVTYQKCIIRWDRFWELPSKKTTFFPRNRALRRYRT